MEVLKYKMTKPPSAGLGTAGPFLRRVGNDYFRRNLNCKYL
ncbi:hypothetical protein X929_00210 [Petrotoga olearia DSM 13574]|uniref:Uncharacterized protein n=1 Tax=Petrotoga olearia DSM 13574 TaxID=1122955 RepID=A0A2K1P7C2_9BACT|nr:hypothetical protein X929_00210 [Petrotoga olearia DSM 13574]